MTTTMPAMGDAQHSAWTALLDLYDRRPTGWTLVGGQMVHLHCAERGASPTRPTDDVDAVLDVRAEPHALKDVTTTLTNLGFTSAGTSWNGHQHRWIRDDDAVIDVLIPRHLGIRAASRTGAAGGTTLETPGAQQALDRTEDVAVDVAGRVGTVRRPNLLGALVAKAAAHTVTVDVDRERHITDFAVLTTLIVPSDAVHAATKRDRRYLDQMVAVMTANERAWAGVAGAGDGLERLRLALASRRRGVPVASSDTGSPWAQLRQPRGVPTGGQFSGRVRGGPDTRL